MRTGKVGKDVDVKQAYDDARLVGLQLLALMKEAAAGDLTRVEVLKLLGMVNATPEFGQHPEVINGWPELLVEVLGESGRHALRRRNGFASPQYQRRDRSHHSHQAIAASPIAGVL